MKNRVNTRLWVSLSLILCALAFGILGTVFPLVQTGKTVPNTGSVKGIRVGIYWNSSCTNRTSQISWGLLEPNSNRTVTVYIRNEGNAVAKLSMTAQNWSPSTASSYMTLKWNYAGQTLQVNQVLQVKLTLVVSSTVSGITNFTFDITVTATG